MGYAMPSIESLKAELMQEVEAKLVQRESTLWRKGQVEIDRLQQMQRSEITEVKASMEKIQERQSALVNETKKIKGALLDVTAKFELVVLEMRQVLPRVRPVSQIHSTTFQPYGHLHSHMEVDFSPSHSIASTSASEFPRAGAFEDARQTSPTEGSSICTDSALLGSVDRSFNLDRSFQSQTGCSSSRRPEHLLGTPASTTRQDLAGAMDEDAPVPEALGAKFLTPPRVSVVPAAPTETQSSPTQDTGASSAAKAAGTAAASAGGATSSSAALPGLPLTKVPHSPAVLSIANALDGGAVVTPQRGTPFSGKRLALAECLDQPDVQSVAVSSAAAAALPSYAPTTPPNTKRMESKAVPAVGVPQVPSPVPPPVQHPQSSLPSASPLSSASVDPVETWPAAPASLLAPASESAEPTMVAVVLTKEEGFTTLGIEVKQVENTMHVEGIDGYGLVHHHNLSQEDDSHRVCAGDVIVEVNGIKGNPSEMLMQCKVSQRIAFTLLRPTPAASSSNSDLAPAAEASPPGLASRMLRPEAQEFVPAAQTEVVANATAVDGTSPPPGLDRHDGVVPAAQASSVLISPPPEYQQTASDATGIVTAAQPTQPVQQVTPSTTGADTVSDESTSVVKRQLFMQ